MHAKSPWWPRLVALLTVHAALLVPTGAAGPPSEAAPATVLPQATVQRGPLPASASATPQAAATVQRPAGRAGRSHRLLGDMNDDGVVDIRDYPIWRQQFGATNSGNPADLNGDCIVEIRDYGIWQQNFRHIVPPLTPTPGLPGRAYVVNHGTGDVSVIDTTTNTIVCDPIRGLDGDPFAVGVDPTLHRAYVINDTGTISVLDTTTNTIVGAPISLGPGAIIAVGVDPTLHRAYVANTGINSNNVTVIDRTTNAVVGGPIEVGLGPPGVGIGP